MSEPITDGRDESKLPKWAQDRLRNLRRKIERLSVETVNRDDLPSDVRVMIARSTQNERYQTQPTAIPLNDNDRVIFVVTGGQMEVELQKFGSRYRLGIVGYGDYDPPAGCPAGHRDLARARQRGPGRVRHASTRRNRHAGATRDRTGPAGDRPRFG